MHKAEGMNGSTLPATARQRHPNDTHTHTTHTHTHINAHLPHVGDLRGASREAGYPDGGLVEVEGVERRVTQAPVLGCTLVDACG